MKITAKAICRTRVTDPNGGDQDVVTFAADYSPGAGGVNEDWARYTPNLSFSMHVRKSVPFEVGKRYTLTFDDGE